MTAILEKATLMASLPQVIHTATASDSALGSVVQSDSNLQEWDELIYGKLVEWGKNPAMLEDEDFIVPSSNSIRLGCKVARRLKEEGAQAPLRVVPDGEGGISFEWRQKNVYFELRVQSDGTGEWLEFKGGKLVGRGALEFDSGFFCGTME